MKKNLMRLTVVATLCMAMMLGSMVSAHAASKFTWHKAEVLEVGITGPDNWFARLKTDSGEVRVTFVSASIRKELLAIALTAKSSGQKVQALYVGGLTKSGCKGMYIINEKP